jgi:drug/metabolite transporter (DMT)-like permease
MVAVLLALAAAVSFGGSDYAAGLASRKTEVLRVTVAAEGVNAAVVIPVVLLVSSRPPSVLTLGWGAAAGVSGVGGLMALFTGFRYAAFNVVSPVSAVTAAGLSVLVGLLSGERPGVLWLVGMLLTAPAIVAVSAGAARLNAAQPERSSAATAAGTADDPPAVQDSGARAVDRSVTGVVWSLAAGAGFALFLIGLNRAGSANDLWPAGAADVAGLVTVVSVAAVRGQLALPPAGTPRRLSMLSGLVAAAGTLSVFLATHRGLLAVTAVIYSLYPAVTIILARIHLHERLTKAGICGLCLAVASVSLIAAGSAG